MAEAYGCRTRVSRADRIRRTWPEDCNRAGPRGGGRRSGSAHGRKSCKPSSERRRKRRCRSPWVEIKTGSVDVGKVRLAACDPDRAGRCLRRFRIVPDDAGQLPPRPRSAPPVHAGAAEGGLAAFFRAQLRTWSENRAGQIGAAELCRPPTRKKAVVPRSAPRAGSEPPPSSRPSGRLGHWMPNSRWAPFRSAPSRSAPIRMAPSRVAPAHFCSAQVAADQIGVGEVFARKVLPPEIAVGAGHRPGSALDCDRGWRRGGRRRRLQGRSLSHTRERTERQGQTRDDCIPHLALEITHDGFSTKFLLGHFAGDARIALRPVSICRIPPAGRRDRICPGFPMRRRNNCFLPLR